MSYLLSSRSYQSRVLEVFHDGKGYLVGSIEGRVGVQWFPELYDASNNRKSFTFRCHRLDM